MEFSSSQAALRIRRVQMLCAQNGLDGVLLVPGVDGRFSVCNQAMGYLFSGRSNRDTIDVVKLDAQLDDAVALVTPTEVRLYSPDAELREQLQALLAPHVASLRILGPTVSEAADPDLLEENKLASFVHMLRGCQRLGIPCSLAPAPPQKPEQPSDQITLRLGADQLLVLEKWPLLQAYGLEGVGRSGFFTMNFQIHDVQPYMQLLYGELDGRSLEVLVSEAVPTLRQHWDEMLQVLGGKPAGQRAALSEKQLVEPLAGYFAYGLLRAAPGVDQMVTLPPRAICGPRTSDDSARSEGLPLSKCGSTTPTPSSPSSEPHPTSNHHHHQEPALHWVVEGADPRSPLRAARSYFLARGMVARDVFADPEDDADQGFEFSSVVAGWEGPAGEVVMLMRLYSALVEAARAAMNHFATVDGATALSAKSEAVEVLSRRGEQLGVGGALASLTSRLRFTLLQMDHVSRMTVPAVRGSRQLKIIRLSLPDIPRKSGGKMLGGLVYGDTFLELPPPLPYTTASGASTVAGGWRLLVLTEGIPALVAVPGGGGCEEVLAGRALRSLMRVVEEGGAGSNGLQTSQARTSTRTTSLASQRELERRAAGAAAEAEAQAAKLRARKLGDSEQEQQQEDGEDVVDELEEEPAATAPSSATATATATRLRPADALGRLLTLGGGGDDAVLLTGAPACPTLYGTLYCFSAGLVFVEAVSRALWVLDLRGGGEAVAGSPAGGVEAVTIQQLPLPQVAAAAAGGEGEAGGGGRVGLGEAVVFRGTSPACGLPPACHLTINTHVALPLEAMSSAARRFLIQSVLPAWQQTCRETAAAAATAELRGSSPASYLKDMAAPNPFPPGIHRAHAYAIQSSSAAGAVKIWPAVMADDSVVRSAITGLDAEELRGPLSGLDPSVEALLLQPPPLPTAATATAAASGGSVTLIVGLPGADQSSVAAAVASMIGGSGGGSGGGVQGQVAVPRVALLPPDEGPLKEEHFAAALAAAAAGAAAAAAAAPRHLVLATSSNSGLLEQLRMLAAAAVGGAAGRWRLAAVVVCVSGDVSYEEPSRGVLAGGLLAQMLPGFVDCVVLGGSDAAKVSELSQLVISRLPEVPLVRSGRTALLRARQELLPPPAERAVRLASQRATADRVAWAPLAAAAAGSGGGGGSCAGGLFGPLRATRVVVEGGLDVAKLRDALADLGVPQDPARVPRLPLMEDDNHHNYQRNDQQQNTVVSGKRLPISAAGSAATAPTPAAPAPTHASGSPGGTGGTLVCVSGCLRRSPGGGLMEVVGTRQAALRSREWPLTEAAPALGAPVLPPDGHSPGGELLFIGSGAAVEPNHLKALLAGCGIEGDSNGSGGGAAASSTSRSGTAAAAVVPVPASAAELTSSQRTAIRDAHLWDPLPEGYCFNGTQYFDAFGDASLEHPHMDRFIAQWIAEQQQQQQAVRVQRDGPGGRSAGSGPCVVRVMGPTRL